ncbi:MAG: tetratricopeptide repeat protein [Proteobacteria bacterium]|nr:tetratricopeptide repeat protein [Pseudomonadota bacterium]
MHPGSTLGRYELHHVLGRGGMGTVWEATLRGPAGFTKRVALKVLTDGGDGLIREARLGGLLRHPNLVEVYALEEIDQTWVCAMELMRGGSLAGHVLPPRAVVEVGIQVAQGLAHAHEEVGLVHLDLKPENLLLHHGMVKVADLGISRARGFAREGRVQGTRAYMSPEHWSGAEVDARADIFALGVVLVALATGAPDRHPDAVPWLAGVLRRCLPVEREARFTSMGEVVEALRRVEVSGPGLSEWTQPGEVDLSLLSASTDFSQSPIGAYRALTNMGEEPDRFVGRETETAAALALLDGPVLATLKGMGGIGKTRLARRVGRLWHERTGSPAWFVDLAGARTAADVQHAVATVLEVPLRKGALDTQAQTIGWAIEARGDMLLVLDNFEQVAEHVGLVRRWRELAPQARFLVTSRSLLGVRGEQVLEVGPLAADEASALLLSRAVARGFRFTQDPAIPELVKQLDYLPLAIELAASRLAVLDPAKLLARLDRRFSLLRRKDPALTPREATLRGMLDWSWERLSKQERAVLAQCSVFVDGFTIDAAEQVVEVTGDEWVVDVVETLLNGSLLTTQRAGRLGMLVSVQAYVRQHDRDSVAAAERRHASYFAEPGSRGKHADEEAENLRHACRRAVLGDWPEAADLLEGVWSMLRLSGPFELGVTLGRQALACTLSAEDRGRVELTLGGALQRSGHNAEAAETLERALRGFEARGDALGTADALRWIGVMHRATGDMEAARTVLQRGLEASGDDIGRRGAVRAELAVVHHYVGESTEAAACFEQALADLRAVGDEVVEGRALGNRGNLLLDMGQVDQARSCYARAMALHRRVGARASEAVVLTNLSGLEYERGRFDEAEEGYAKALEMHRNVGARAAVAHVLGDLGVLHVQRGRLAEAEASYRGALLAQQDVGGRAALAHAQYNLGALLARSARHDDAVAHLEAALGGYRALGDVAGEGCVIGTLGSMHLVLGRMDEARQELDEALRLVRSVKLRRAEGSFLGDASVLSALDGDATSARAQSADGESILRAIEDPVQLGLLLCRRAHMERSLGDAQAAERAFSEASDIAETLGVAPGSPLGDAVSALRDG